MSLPIKNRKWLKEIQLAFKRAQKSASKNDIDRRDIYLLAPEYMAKNRGISSSDLIAEMLDTVKSEYARELPLEPGARESYLFHFVLYYVHCHAYAEILYEKECDNLMEYIVANWNLWPEESEPDTV